MGKSRKSAESPHRDQIVAIMSVAYALEKRDQIPLLEEAIRIADAHLDDEFAYELRLELVEAGSLGGMQDRALIAFAWCLAYKDRTEPGWDDWDLLWKYKWIMGALPDFPAISRQQIDAAFADMEKRFTAAGFGPKSVYQLRSTIARDMGDADGSAKWAKLWKAAPNDGLADCRACQTHADVVNLLAKNKLDAALKKAVPITTGRQSCAEVPISTYARLLLPLVNAGDLAQAYDFHRRKYSATTRNPDFLHEIGYHISFMAITGNTKTAVRLLESRLPWAAVEPNSHRRFIFFLGARLLMLRLLGDGTKELRLKLPEQFATESKATRRPTQELADFFLNEATALASAFNARNGNEHYTKLLREHEAFAKHFTTYEPPPKS